MANFDEATPEQLWDEAAYSFATFVPLVIGQCHLDRPIYPDVEALVIRYMEREHDVILEGDEDKYFQLIKEVYQAIEYALKGE